MKQKIQLRRFFAGAKFRRGTRASHAGASLAVARRQRYKARVVRAIDFFRSLFRLLQRNETKCRIDEFSLSRNYDTKPGSRTHAVNEKQQRNEARVWRADYYLPYRAARHATDQKQ